MMPQQLCALLSAVGSAVEHKFVGRGRASVFTFALLYFFCPALVHPDATWPAATFDTVARRSLRLVAKLLMSLATGTAPHEMEPYMARVAAFGANNRGAALVFVHEIEVSVLSSCGIVRAGCWCMLSKLTSRPLSLPT